MRSALGLALVNARRSLGSAVLATVAMAVAAGGLTVAVSPFRSLPASVVPLVARLGGDALVVHAPIGVSARTVWEAAGGRPPAFGPLPLDAVTDLGPVAPELYTVGALSPAGPVVRWLPAEDVVAALGGLPGVRAVAPSYLLPALESFESLELGRTVTAPILLRGHPLDTGGLAHGERWIQAGRPLLDCDAGRLVALIGAERDTRLMPYGVENVDRPRLGGTVTVRVPAIAIGEDGSARFDYSRARDWTFTIVGLYHSRPPGATGATPPQGPDLVIPADTFAAVYRAAAGDPAAPVRVPQAAVRLRSLGRDGLLTRLAAALPGAAVVPVERLAPGTRPDALLAVRLDLDVYIGLALYLLAGLLLATNMWLLLSRRRTEMGVLRAVGASGRDVAVMVVAEALVYALAGAAAGWLTVRLGTVWQVFQHGATQAELVRLMLREAGAVAGATVGFTLLFALIPAVRAARTPTMEVFRQ